MKNTIISQILLILFVLGVPASSYAQVLTSELSEKVVLIDKEPVQIEIAGSTEANINIVIRVSSAKHEYKINEYSKSFGIWSLRKPRIIKDRITFYQLFSNKELLLVTDLMQLQQYGLNPEDVINSQSHNEDAKFIMEKLESDGLIRRDVRSIESIGERFYRRVLVIPESAMPGMYQVDVYGFDSQGQLVNQDVSYFNVSSVSSHNWFSDLLKNHSIIYALLCVFMAISIGFIAGILKNAAKQQ